MTCPVCAEFAGDFDKWMEGGLLRSWTDTCLLFSGTIVGTLGKHKRACECLTSLTTLDQCLCMTPADAKESLQLHCGIEDGHLQTGGIADQLCQPHRDSLTAVIKHVGSAQGKDLESHVLLLLSRQPYCLAPRTINVAKKNTRKLARRYAGAQVRNSTSPQAAQASAAVTTGDTATGGGATHSTPQPPVPSAQTGAGAATGGNAPPSPVAVDPQTSLQQAPQGVAKAEQLASELCLELQTLLSDAQVCRSKTPACPLILPWHARLTLACPPIMCPRRKHWMLSGRCYGCTRTRRSGRWSSRRGERSRRRGRQQSCNRKHNSCSRSSRKSGHKSRQVVPRP